MEFGSVNTSSQIKSKFEPYFLYLEQEIINSEQINSDRRMFNSCIIENFQTVLVTTSGPKECTIRVVEGPAEVVCQYANNELLAYYLLFDSHFFTKPAGFCISEESQGRVTYKIAIEIYLKRLEDAKVYSEYQKNKIISNLFLAVNELNCKDVFHGSLFIKNIFLDEQLNPKIKFDLLVRSSLFFEESDFFYYFKDLLNLEECDLKYLPPEFTFILQLLNKYQMLYMNNPKKIDIYTIGITGCIILGLKLNDLKTINIDTDINMKSIHHFITYEEYLETEDSREAILYFEEIRPILKNNIYKSNSIKIRKLLNDSTEINHNLRSFDINYAIMEDPEEDEEINIDQRILLNTLKRECAKILILIAKGNFNDANQLANKTLTEHEKEFSMADNKYYNTKCSAEYIKRIEGIFLFFYHLLSLLSHQLENFFNSSDPLNQKKEVIPNFQQLIYRKIRESQTNFPENFYIFFDKLIKSDKIKKNYIIQALLVFQLDDWKYYFCSSILDTLKFEKLTDFPLLIQEITIVKINKNILHYKIIIINS